MFSHMIIRTGISIDPTDAGLIEYGTPDACSLEDHKSGRKGCKCYNSYIG